MNNFQTFWGTGEGKSKGLGNWKKSFGQCLGGKTERWMKIEFLRKIFKLLEENKTGKK